MKGFLSNLFDIFLLFLLYSVLFSSIFLLTMWLFCGDGGIELHTREIIKLDANWLKQDYLILGDSQRRSFFPTPTHSQTAAASVLPAAFILHSSCIHLGKVEFFFIFHSRIVLSLQHSRCFTIINIFSFILFHHCYHSAVLSIFKL